MISLFLTLTYIQIFRIIFLKTLLEFILSTFKEGFKGTVISSDPPCKDGNARFITVALNPQLCGPDDILLFLSLNVFNFIIKNMFS